ncbi:MAG TPA: ChuX/HutX family heme-like substrate-binding protein, partial [Salinarimonas sp.]|nr:ChuX/HutX family heme-like substrate-binding protein [Salinarimonas sp.]
MDQTVDDPVTAIRTALAEKPDGVLETLAERHGVSLRMVLDALPEGQATAIDGARFPEIWAELGTWGTVMLIVH